MCRHTTVTDRVKLRVQTPKIRSIPQAAASIVYAALDPELAQQSGEATLTGKQVIGCMCALWSLSSCQTW